MFGITFITLCLVTSPHQSEAAQKYKHKTEQSTKDRLVLMPLRIPEEDKDLAGSMETALVNGLQQKYDVYSGEVVSKKAHEIFMKENRNTKHTECDAVKCMQNIAMAFQAELIATANITKKEGSYFLALSIQNIFDNKVVQSESQTCKNCDATQVIDKLKELSGVLATIAPTPEAQLPKVKGSDAETDLWDEVKNSNTEDDYKAYLKQYPKGKYTALARSRLEKIQAETKAEAGKQEKQIWTEAQQTKSIEGYESYLSDYPKGRFAILAQVRVTKLKKEQAAEERKQQREHAAENTKLKREDVASSQTKPKQQVDVPKSFVSQGSLTWMPVSFARYWWDANAYCRKAVINEQIGWRLPTKDELKAVHYSGMMKDPEGTFDLTWSSTPGSTGGHYVVGLVSGAEAVTVDTSGPYYVTCVREQAQTTGANQSLSDSKSRTALIAINNDRNPMKNLVVSNDVIDKMLNQLRGKSQSYVRLISSCDNIQACIKDAFDNGFNKLTILTVNTKIEIQQNGFFNGKMTVTKTNYDLDNRKLLDTPSVASGEVQGMVLDWATAATKIIQTF
jgi:hypothetical protein